MTKGGEKPRFFPPLKGFFVRLQLDAMPQTLKIFFETSMVLTYIPQKNFDTKYKMFNGITFFSKSNAAELSLGKSHSVPQMKLLNLMFNRNGVFRGFCADKTC